MLRAEGIGRHLSLLERRKLLGDLEGQRRGNGQIWIPLEGRRPHQRLGEVDRVFDDDGESSAGHRAASSTPSSRRTG